MELHCFPTANPPPQIVPGRPQRAWMDAFPQRHAYRCLPLTMANTTGWEILCPFAFSAEWNGGQSIHDIKITADVPADQLDAFVKSHFSAGVLTMHPGYLFRTEPGWSMWCMGPPNHMKDGIQPLSGVIETDWVPFPFTMNWLFTRPGKISFNKSEPFCFITLVQDKVMDDVQPVIRQIESDPDFLDQYQAWFRLREKFNSAVEAGDPAALKAAWQKLYFNGELPEKTPGQTPAGHVNKRRLKRPTTGA